MNRLQRWIANASGLSAEAQQVQTAYVESQVALEQITHVRALVEIKLDELAYAGYSPIKEVVTLAARDKSMIRRLRILRHENPLAKQAMKLVFRFVLGRGIDYLVKDERAREIWDEFWKDPVNELSYTGYNALKERLDEALTDGENFFICAATPGVAPYVRMAKIPMEEIVDIVPDPGNSNIPLFYKRIWVPMVYDASMNGGTGGWKEEFTGSQREQVKYYQDYRIPDEYIALLMAMGKLSIPESKIDEQKMKHRYLNPLWTVQGYRGTSELFASREWFKVYREFMEARAAINDAANAISFVRKKKTGPSGVANITGKFGGLDLAQDQDVLTGAGLMRRATRPVPGAIYDTAEDVDIAALRADTGAQDALSDGRSLLQSAGAGTGTMLPYFGDGGDANLATAQTMELPMVKMYEEYQEWVENDLTETYFYVLAVALSSETREDIPEEMRVISWDFPPIIAKDVTKYITAWAQMTQQIAPGNLALQEVAIKGALTTMDVPNVDAVMPDIMEAQQELQKIKDQERELRMQLMQTAPGPGRSSEPPQEGQKAGNGGYTPGLDPDSSRVAKGKPPRDTSTGPRSRRQ